VKRIILFRTVVSHLRRMNDTWSQMGEMGSNLLTAEFQGLWLIPLLALPNAIYIWLWILPGAWINTTKRATPIFGGSWPSDKTSQGDKACQYLAVLAHTIKMIQAACVVAWFRLYSPDSLTPSAVLAQPAWRLALGVAGVAFGQCLNVAIYAAIGRNGVYYGSRLGAPPLARGAPDSPSTSPSWDATPSTRARCSRCGAACCSPPTTPPRPRASRPSPSSGPSSTLSPASSRTPRGTAS